MNKKKLIAKISSSMNLNKADAERTFDGITEIILNCLKSDEQVKIISVMPSNVRSASALLRFIDDDILATSCFLFI